MRNVSQLVFRPDGEVLAAIAGDSMTCWSTSFPLLVRDLNPWFKKLSREQLDEWKPLQKWTGVIGQPRVTTAEGRMTLGNSQKNKLELTDAVTKEVLTRFEVNATSVAIAPNQRLFAVSSRTRNGSLQLCNLRTGTIVHNFQGYQEPLEAVTFSPDGHHLYAAGLRVLGKWDVASQANIWSIPIPGRMVDSVQLSADERLIYLFWYNTKVEVYTEETRRHLASLTCQEMNWIRLPPDLLGDTRHGHWETLMGRTTSTMEQP